MRRCRSVLTGRPSTARTSERGSTCWPIVAITPLTVTRPAATMSSARRRDAIPASASAFWMRTRWSLSSLIDEAQRRLGVERWQLVERGQAESLKKIEPGAVQDGATRRIGTAELHDQSTVEQASHNVVGVHAADALDDTASHRLAIGDDRQSLQCSRRQADAVRADVSGNQRAGLGRRRQLDSITGSQQPNTARPQRDFEIAKQGVHGLAVNAGK